METLRKTLADLLNIPLYQVGGSVRDELMGLEPKDYDFATPLLPGAVEKAIRDASKHPYIVGRRFGTLGVKIDGVRYEITTFRQEKYGNNRKPEVEFVGDIVADLSRRDFTINAMARGKRGLIDPFGGREDIELKKIRCVGEPKTRFKEDPLRMLRGIRFATQFGFTFDLRTLHKIIKMASYILTISKERWVMELDKILMMPEVDVGLSYIMETRLMNYMIPELGIQHEFNQHTPYHKFGLWTHTMKTVKYTEPDLNLRWAALLHDVGKALDINTPIATFNGFKLMKDIQIGDKVFDEQGQPCNVVATTQPEERESYKIVFDDNSEIIASDNHLWCVLNMLDRKSISGNNVDYRHNWNKTKIITTSQMIGKLKYGKQLNLSIPCCGSLKTEGTIKYPYTLGAWLGDGTSFYGNITSSYSDFKCIEQNIKAEGLRCILIPSTMRDNYAVWNIRTFVTWIKQLGVWNNKHIPDNILRTDETTRLSILQGIMDTDGYNCSNAAVGIQLSNKKLFSCVCELVASFGWKKWVNTKGLFFVPDKDVFRLPRKLEKQGNKIRPQMRKHTHRMIKSIVSMGTTTVKCIEVDSKNKMYLAGDSLIPTHNCFVQTWKNDYQAYYIDHEKVGKEIAIKIGNYLKWSKDRIKTVSDLVGGHLGDSPLREADNKAQIE